MEKDEILLYDEAIGTYQNSGGPGPVGELIFKGHYKLLIAESTDGSKVVIIVDILTHPDGERNLRILMLAGVGGFRYFDDILESLIDLGRDEYCEKLIMEISPERFAKFRELHEFPEPEGVVVSFKI